MAPYARPSGAPATGGIFNDFNSTHHNSTHPDHCSDFLAGLPVSVVRVRDAISASSSALFARSNDGGASAALIFAIVVPTFFVIVGLLAIIHHAIQIRKVAKAKRAARRANRSGKSSRSGSSRSGSSRSTRSTRSTRTGSSHPARSYGNFDDVPIHSPSAAYVPSSRSHDSDDGSDSAASDLHSSAFFRMGERIAAREY